MIEERYAPLPPEPQDPSIPWKPASAVERCEKSGGHVVKVPTWPPTKTPAPHEPPSLAATCERCDATLVLYEDTTGVRIITPEGAARK